MFPNGVPSTLLRGLYKGVGFKRLDPAIDGPKIIEELEFKFDRSWPLDAMINSFVVWNSLVQAYTRCRLKNRQDKLIAISAIAKQFQPLFKDEYIAGLWKRHLAQHLLWHVAEPRTVILPTTNSENYVAPSWSWASLNGPVTTFNLIARHDKPVMVEMLEVEVKPVTADKMGQVSGGYIKVRCWLKQLSPPELDYDDPEDSNPMWMFKTPGITHCFFFPDHLPLPADLKWYCVPVLETAEEDEDDKTGELDRSVHGLVLLKTENENEYRRVGRFVTQGDTYKFFKRPTYPFPMPESPEENDIGSPSVLEAQAKIDETKSSVAERVTKAAQIETNRTTSSSSTLKRRFISFFSRKGQDKESQVIKGQGPASDPLVEHIITII